MNDTDEKVDDEFVNKVMYEEYKGKTFNEHLDIIKARQRAREAAAESANEVVYAGNGTAAFGGGGTSAHRKQIWISTVAIAMCLILMFSLLGGFLYFHFRENTYFDPVLESDLVMVEIDYLTLQQQDIFVPNLSSLTDVTILRGNHKETEETIMFRIAGFFDSSIVSIRIVVHDRFMPSDQEYFEDGSYITVDERLVSVNTATQEGRHFYWLIFADNNTRYFVVLTAQNSGEHLDLLDEIFQERKLTYNPPNGDTRLTSISLGELFALEIFKLNFIGLDNITVKRSNHRDGRVLMYVVEGYFGGCHMFLRIIMTGAGYIPDDIGNFGGTDTVMINGQMVFVNYVQENNQYIYRLMFAYDFEVLHFIELTTPNSGEYKAFLSSILQ